MSRHSRAPRAPILKAGGLFAAAAALALLAGCSSSPKPPSPNEPTTFNVDVGWEDPSKGTEAQGFFPRSVSVNVGDTVVFTERTHEPHTVTFNAPAPGPDLLLPQSDGSVRVNPVIVLSAPPTGASAAALDLGAGVDREATLDGTGLVSSGLLLKPGDRFSVHVAAPGTWQVVCLVDSAVMKGTLIVNPKGTLRPMGDPDYRTAADARAKDAKQKAADLLTDLHVPAAVEGADGHRTWTVYAGAGSVEDGIDVMRFLGGEKLSIKVGDSVTFDVSHNRACVLHTVTFLAGAAVPTLITPQAQPGDPSVFLVNPKVLTPSPLPAAAPSPTPAPGPAPAPAAAWDGSGWASSGLMVTGRSPHTWTLTFAAPGSFDYQCLVHGGEGMKGTITVQP